MARADGGGGMTTTEMQAVTAIAIEQLERVRVGLRDRVEQQERGNLVFETYSAFGGAVCNVQHALGMLHELEGGE